MKSPEPKKEVLKTFTSVYLLLLSLCGSKAIAKYASSNSDKILILDHNTVDVGQINLNYF